MRKIRILCVDTSRVASIELLKSSFTCHLRLQDCSSSLIWDSLSSRVFSLEENNRVDLQAFADHYVRNTGPGRTWFRDLVLKVFIEACFRKYQGQYSVIRSGLNRTVDDLLLCILYTSSAFLLCHECIQRYVRKNKHSKRCEGIKRIEVK
jgi:hypothetical protein